MNTPSNTTDSASLVAIVSLGSNLASGAISPADLVASAMGRLRKISIESLASSLYRSEPLDCPADSGDFINAVMGLRVSSSTSAAELLAVTQRIEAEFGRQRGSERNQARTLDIDIISYGDQLLESEDLTLPHPRATERRFVLLPLSEIYPDMVLPGQSMSIMQLLALLPEREKVERLA